MKISAWMGVLCLLCGCRSAPPAASPDAGVRVADAGSGSLVYSYVDETGRIRMAGSVEEVPQDYRDQVVVTDTGASRAKRLATDRILVMDLREQSGGRPLNYSVVDLDSLQRAPAPAREARDPGELGKNLVQKASDRIEQALGLRRPPGAARVILYSASWCGYCKKAARHLRARKVAFEEKDIERDRGAAVELSRKLRQAGISGGGVPVLDVGGTMVVGFNRDKIDRLLDEMK